MPASGTWRASARLRWRRASASAASPTTSASAGRPAGPGGRWRRKPGNRNHGFAGPPVTRAPVTRAPVPGAAVGAGQPRREAARRGRPPALDRDPDERLALTLHRRPVLVPVVMLAGDGAEVVDQRIECRGQIEYLGSAADLHPRAVPGIGQDHEGD